VVERRRRTRPTARAKNEQSSVSLSRVLSTRAQLEGAHHVREQHSGASRRHDHLQTPPPPPPANTITIPAITTDRHHTYLWEAPSAPAADDEPTGDNTAALLTKWWSVPFSPFLCFVLSFFLSDFGPAVRSSQ
jgi:hypothetical protein